MTPYNIEGVKTVSSMSCSMILCEQVLRRHPAENSFANFGYLTLYQITFFIFFTTIGLNIIFGIIVDTFSELRDLKVSVASQSTYMYMYMHM